eukprot:TRINITY_DN5784_c1_g1_i1.p1 TRINITY_DN5784_c1_g1~~TRINITY_DN5784_c1_g1_i1.p1  ORF type:complete len:411 (+),score=54.83 TRINITY_DN5784_c1_g1_i1:704-1936(+)
MGCASSKQAGEDLLLDQSEAKEAVVLGIASVKNGTSIDDMPLGHKRLRSCSIESSASSRTARSSLLLTSDSDFASPSPYALSHASMLVRDDLLKPTDLSGGSSLSGAKPEVVASPKPPALSPQMADATCMKRSIFPQNGKGSLEGVSKSSEVTASTVTGGDKLSARGSDDSGHCSMPVVVSINDSGTAVGPITSTTAGATAGICASGINGDRTGDGSAAESCGAEIGTVTAHESSATSVLGDTITPPSQGQEVPLTPKSLLKSKMCPASTSCTRAFHDSDCFIASASLPSVRWNDFPSARHLSVYIDQFSPGRMARRAASNYNENNGIPNDDVEDGDDTDLYDFSQQPVSQGSIQSYAAERAERVKQASREAAESHKWGAESEVPPTPVKRGRRKSADFPESPPKANMAA